MDLPPDLVMDMPPVVGRPPRAPRYTSTEAARKTIWQYFQRTCPSDAVGAMGKQFVKRSCSRCWGRGLQTTVAAGSQAGADGELKFCECARLRFYRAAQKLMVSQDVYEGQDLQ